MINIILILYNIYFVMFNHWFYIMFNHWFYIMFNHVMF